eukprot:gene18701-25223_t
MAAPFLAHQYYTQMKSPYKWMLFGDDDTLFFLHGMAKFLQPFDASLPYWIGEHVNDYYERKGYAPVTSKNVMTRTNPNRKTFHCPSEVGLSCLPCHAHEAAEVLTKKYAGTPLESNKWTGCPCTTAQTCAQRMATCKVFPEHAVDKEMCHMTDVHHWPATRLHPNRTLKFKSLRVPAARRNVKLSMQRRTGMLVPEDEMEKRVDLVKHPKTGTLVQADQLLQPQDVQQAPASDTMGESGSKPLSKWFLGLIWSSRRALLVPEDEMEKRVDLVNHHKTEILVPADQLPQLQDVQQAPASDRMGDSGSKPLSKWLMGLLWGSRRALLVWSERGGWGSGSSGKLGHASSGGVWSERGSDALGQPGQGGGSLFRGGQPQRGAAWSEGDGDALGQPGQADSVVAWSGGGSGSSGKQSLGSQGAAVRSGVSGEGEGQVAEDRGVAVMSGESGEGEGEVAEDHGRVSEQLPVPAKRKAGFGNINFSVYSGDWGLSLLFLELGYSITVPDHSALKTGRQLQNSSYFIFHPSDPQGEMDSCNTTQSKAQCEWVWQNAVSRHVAVSHEPFLGSIELGAAAIKESALSHKIALHMMKQPHGHLGGDIERG